MVDDFTIIINRLKRFKFNIGFELEPNSNHYHEPIEQKNYYC